MRTEAALIFLAFSTIAFAQPGAIPTPLAIPADSFQVRYATNLPLGDSIVNITNTGALILPSGLMTTGNMCANVYTFTASQTMVSCCSCLVTPNGLTTLSVRNDLLGNTSLLNLPSSVVVKLLATTPLGLSPIGAGGTCNPTSPTSTPAGPGVFGSLVPGMRAWGTTLHAVPAILPTFTATETAFEPSALSPGELTKLVTSCSAIQTSGSAICKSCRTQ